MSGGKRRPAAPRLRPDALDRVGNEQLRTALLDKLSVAELNELTRQIERAVERACREAAARATEEAYERQFAVMMRVLRDRHGFGRVRLRRTWNDCLEYIHDIDEGRLTTAEMLACLEHQDGIRLRWKVNLPEEQT